MLILTKMKYKIINLDNVESISYFVDNRHTIGNKLCTVRAFTTPTKSIDLGYYWSVDRCQEILLEIMKKAEVGNRVYYMPEE